MNYHDIKHDDMLNGDGLRVTLFVSGCEHNCAGCHNPQTHSLSSGIPFDNQAKQEIFNELSKPYISGITISGGDPFHPENIAEVTATVKEIKELFPDKDIWVYTGYTYEEIADDNRYTEALRYIDVLVDGEFDIVLVDVNEPWVGSTNQRVIRMKSIPGYRVRHHEN